MPSLLHRCKTKATIAEGDQMRYGPNWLLSRRGTLKVFDDHLECGDWRVEYEHIREAILYSVRSNFIFPGYVLKVETAEEQYHFGLNSGEFWKCELPFPVRREKGRLGYSLFSLTVRTVVAGYLLYLAWLWISTWR
ncbi:hypothetical protein [Candidatus Laterigemmans baculatus]|uniref:hypothetical protein n=1 Tax=Candidatus Laterigemmans baculatus TaxID=2770505 RepID=UPI0013DA90E3|nr:hypothetical protein [Candidatus Laterigemmans baculatus]